MKDYLDIEKIIAHLRQAASGWSVESRSLLIKAIVFVRKKHAGQTYAPASEYAIHPLRAALTLAELKTIDPDVVIATILHDTLEDTKTEEDELRAEFGDRIATLVKLVSHRYSDGATVIEQIAAKRENQVEIQRGPIEVRYLKCADLLDQMRNWKLLPKNSPVRKKLLRFLEEAQSYALPLAEETDQTIAREMRRELQWYYVHAV